MYRDPRTDALARIDAARDTRGRAWTEVTSLLEAIGVLRDQLVAKGIEPPRLPAVEAPADTKLAIDGLSLADALRAADAIERDEQRLRAAAKELTTFVTVLGDRVVGRQSELPLAAPPRAVPFTYVLAEALPSWLLYFIPAAAVAASVFAASFKGEAIARALTIPVFLVPLVVSSWRARRRARFLARCRVASSVTLESSDDTGTENTNWPMRSASGWTVTREGYTGQTVRNHLRWMADDGTSGTLVVRGTPYTDGIVLHEGAQAVCVVDLSCAPRPDHRGEWESKLAFMVWVRIVVVLGLTGAIVFALVGALWG